MTVEKDRVVTIDYSLKDDGGNLLDSSEGAEPLVYLHGNGNLIPGLEKQLEGKNAGDQLSCVVAAADAYGERDDSLVFMVPKTEFGSADVQVGMQFEAQSEQGAQLVTVVGLEGDQVKLDANHPLAGQTLHFDVKVLDVREATSEEIEHGHVHGCEGECGEDCDCGCEGDCGCDHS